MMESESASQPEAPTENAMIQNGTSTRRDILRVSAAASLSVWAAGCTRIVQRATAPSWPADLSLPEQPQPIARLLDRAGFGAAPGEVARVAKIGTAAYLDEQLAPDEQPSLEGEEWRLRARLHGLEVLRGDAMELRDLQEREVLRQLQAASLLRAVYSRRQLRERMVDFWSNHFNIYARKGRGAYLVTGDDITVVRAHALGKFSDLLRASAHSPAMLSFLDNSENRRGVPNENYARELMELHTLGIDGGYSQKDVQEVARCLTGWTIENRFLHRRGTFRFDGERHDDGEKIVLGHRIARGGGQSDGDKVLSILAAHPSTARFLARKLCRYFWGNEDEKWTLRLAQIFTHSGGDIRAMLRPLLASEELISAPPIVKRPFDFLVSSLRATGADSDGGQGLQEHLAKMGQPLWGWPMPDGYPDRTAAWTGSLLARWNFAGALCGNGIAGTAVDFAPFFAVAKIPSTAKDTSAKLDVLIAAILGIEAHSSPIQSLRRTILEPAQKSSQTSLDDGAMAALLLSSPPFQWR